MMGLTLEDLAAAKKLPVEFLRDLGLQTVKLQGGQAVRVPYLTPAGEELAVRYRLALNGGARFRWRKGDKTTLYGLQRIDHARSAGYVLLVEGESDCWSAWFHDVPALGIPGKTIWKTGWEAAVDGLQPYLWCEPGAFDLVERVAKTAKNLRVIYAPDGIKDLSELHLSGKPFADELERLRGGAVLAAEEIAGLRGANIGELEETAKDRGRQRNAKQKQDEPETRQTSFLTAGDILYEQIHNDGKSAFLAYSSRTGEAETVPLLALSDEIVEPINSEDVTLGAVRLPSGVAEYGDTLSLLAEIEAHVYRYLDVSPSYLKFAAYYVLLSWLYDRFHTLPYLRALGDTGCGKSRFLDVIGGLCYKSITASGCVTPAPIYRMLRKWGGTLVLDEADMRNSDEYNEVITILNCGFEKGRPVIRATKDNPDKIQILPVYGPKVFATRRRFQDAALEARCLTEIMVETNRDDIEAVLGRRFFADQCELRNKLLLFRLQNYQKVDPEAGARLNLGNIEPRLKQVSVSFLSLFAREEDVLSSYQQFIQGHQRELIEQRSATKTGQVVEALLKLSGNKVTTVTTITGDNVMNVTCGNIAEQVEMKPQAVGQILKALGLKTKLVKIEGMAQRRIVYDKAKFGKLKKRYVLDEENEEEGETAGSTLTLVTLVTHVTDEAQTSPSDDTSDDKEKVSKPDEADDLCLWKGEI
ncbi:MAG TPA: hypothetical protein VLH40_06875 [Atribacteraceae bacterium]|nr:hypothetical protein [Atribacteraceae bacterium]